MPATRLVSPPRPVHILIDDHGAAPALTSLLSLELADSHEACLRKPSLRHDLGDRTVLSCAIIIPYGESFVLPAIPNVAPLTPGLSLGDSADAEEDYSNHPSRGSMLCVVLSLSPSVIA